jgi:hypothetical protein
VAMRKKKLAKLITKSFTHHEMRLLVAAVETAHKEAWEELERAREPRRVLVRLEKECIQYADLLYKLTGDQT